MIPGTALRNLGAMTIRTDTFDLGALRLTSGEGRRLDLNVAIEPFTLGTDSYTVTPELIPVRLDISRMGGDGYALRLRFSASLDGPCMRCLELATPNFEIDAREISQPGSEDPELDSPYVVDQILDVAAWARDALALALPATVTCRPDCAGLCAVCGENLNTAGPDHHHDSGPDPRWAKLSELQFGS
jgi:uncharacterized protein